MCEMPRLDLPPNSLGPKPTKKQMELLRKIATPGAKVHTWTGVTMGSHGAYINYHKPGEINHETVNRGIVDKFYDYGWLDVIESDWKSTDYRISERAQKVIEKGVTR